MDELMDVPDSCLRGNHDFDQTGRCNECGVDRANTDRSWEDRRSGGLGSLTQPLTNGEYAREMKKLEEKAGK